MYEDDLIDPLLPPVTTNTFGIPNDLSLKTAYEVYKPSSQTKQLFSERNRGVFAEAFIENTRLGTLSDLCVRVLAYHGTRNIPSVIKNDPLKLDVYFDSIDVNLPIEECYFVESQRFWRRVVLSNSHDLNLLRKQEHEYDWKSAAITMKLVKVIESCPAEYWIEKEIIQLSHLIKPYVKNLHLKKLQSLKDRAFEQYFESDSEDASLESSESIEISSDELSTDHVSTEDAEEEESIAGNEIKSASKITVKSSKVHISLSNKKLMNKQMKDVKMAAFEPLEEEPIISEKNSTQVLVEKTLERRNARIGRNMRRQALREAKAAAKKQREEKRKLHELKRKQKLEPPEVVKKKRRRRRIKGVFDIEVEAEPDDGEAAIPDRRNVEKLVRRYKRYDYPPKHCHHIDLSFVKYFDQLTTLTIEFLGSEMGLNFHPRYLNFSYDDITRLARGLRTLPSLKAFGLRNSRMDEKKLDILTRSLKYVNTLETVDLGFDQLKDDCCFALSLLFEQENSIKYLELEYNELSFNSMNALAFALKFNQNNSLKYLGLAYNPLSNEGLEALCTTLIDTEHVEYINLTAIGASEDSVVYYMADLLLRVHRPLEGLHMRAIPLSEKAGREVIQALETNLKIKYFDIRGCGIDVVAEFEADIIMRRNEHIVNNPFIVSGSITNEEVDEYLDQRTHPLIQKILSHFQKIDDCLVDRPPLKSSSQSQIEEEEEMEKTSLLSSKFVIEHEKSIDESFDEELEPKEEPFIFDPNSFNKEEFSQHIFVPGPKDRFYYFRNMDNKFQ